MTALIHTLFPPETAPAKIKGEVRFVSAAERSPSHGSLGMLLTVCVPSPPWPQAGTGNSGQRMKLRDVIEAAIESALEMNDAPAAGVGDFSDLDQCLSDQLYRARSVGAGGLVIYVPDLTSIGSLAGALDAEDSAVLRWWIAATTERPIMLILDDANRHLRAYGPPARLEFWVEQRDGQTPRIVGEVAPKASIVRTVEAPSVQKANANGLESESASATDRAMSAAQNGHAPNAYATNGHAQNGAHKEAALAESGPGTDAHRDVERSTGAHRDVERSTGAGRDVERSTGARRDVERSTGAGRDVERGTGALRDNVAAEERGERSLAAIDAEPAHRDDEDFEQPRERKPAVSHVDLAGAGRALERDLTSLDAESVSAAPTMDEGGHDGAIGRAMKRVLEEAAENGATTSVDRVVPLFPRRESPFRKPMTGGFAVGGGPIDWRGFANDLAGARGPKPLTFVERLFMTRYVPLLESIARGEADDAARRTLEQWGDDFARSYTEGFSALRVTGKRPRMVLDAPQLANQVARLHGAKSTHLVLVDAMRFDLGVRVHDRMCEALTSQATCTERLLLWSALPTTTPVQLDLIAHGPDGLANRPPPSEQEEPGLRGRASPILRRIKLGGRDVLKLDTVQARLHEAGPPLSERLDLLADEVAAILANHARSLPPRSLMLVFGDHGFRMDATNHGTSAGSAGGASPEEVLVPGFAWLVGDVH
jgi:hypothetical protein